ncbi:hypothetical protein Tcan_11427 [Toxocara canis]|uniref:Uncharacterized protein n=1 Tax=Toxocara canis TaxID=6265 RepID=A0A0B2VTE3_TOXCA|nr:hypothetical protein Tcan_11427 [Toxocara canis]
MADYDLLNGGALILFTLSFHVFIFKILSISLVQCKKKKSQGPAKPQQQPKVVTSSSSKPKGESNGANANKVSEQKAINSNKKEPKESAKKCGESENKTKKNEGDGEDKKSEHTEKDSPPIKPAEELRPKKIARNAKEERIAKGKEIRGKGDYPTMDDVLSDWDSEKDGKKMRKPVSHLQKSGCGLAK